MLILICRSKVLILLKLMFDLNGNKVFEIFSGNLNSGVHSFYWDANKFSTGIYIINGSSNNFVSSQKVLLMK